MRAPKTQFFNILIHISGVTTSSECTLPKDGGGCDNKIFRYYYNAIEVSIIDMWKIYFCKRSSFDFISIK